MDRQYIGKYRLVKQLGGGGQGDIYLAWDDEQSGYAAVKVFEKQLLDGIWEARILQSLHHPGIPKFIGQITEDDHLYLVMEYIPGMTMKEYIGSHGRIPERRTVIWGIQLLDILYYLHQRTPPVIHCDIKPSNLMITRKGTLSLIDYGTAVLGKDGIKRKGTRGYAAPEQTDERGHTDEQSDIYSFGMTLYHMATGHHPIQNPWEEDRNYGFSRGFAKVLKKCLNKKKQDRYPTVADVKYGLEKVLKKRARIRTGAAVLLIIAAGAYWKFSSRKEQSVYVCLLSKAEEEQSKANGRFSMKAVRYFEMAIEEDPGLAPAYERLLKYYQSAGKEKEGLAVLAEHVESKDFTAEGKEDLLYRMGLLYLQGKEGRDGYSPDSDLAYRYLSMQEHPSETGRDYTELAGILSGRDYHADRLWRILERCRKKAVGFRQAYLLFQVCRQKEPELKKFGDVQKKQEELLRLMERVSESSFETKSALYEKEAYYEQMISVCGLGPWIKAADQYTDILKEGEEKAGMELKKARLFSEYGRKKEAEEVYQAVIRQYSGWPEGYIAYGFYLAQTGKKSLAQDMYRRAKSLCDGQDTELRKLGAVLGEGRN